MATVIREAAAPQYWTTNHTNCTNGCGRSASSQGHLLFESFVWFVWFVVHMHSGKVDHGFAERFGGKVPGT